MTLLSLATVVLVVLALPVTAQQLRESTDIGHLEDGPDHDPVAAVSEEQRRRIESHDTQRRAADPAASHVPTIIGPTDAAPDITVIQPARAGFDQQSDRNLTRALARPGPAIIRRQPAQRRQGRDAAALDVIIGQRTPMQPVRTYAYPDPPTTVPDNPVSGPSSARPAAPAIAAGSAVYASLDLAVDSRRDGPVVATLLAGQFRGSRVIGSFDAGDDAMVLRFDTLATRAGVTVPVEAYAVDPDCNCFGIAGTVDHHWFARVVLPAATAFAGGFLRATARPQARLVIDGATVTTTSGRTGRIERIAEGAADTLALAAPILAESMPSRATISVAAGTGILVFFRQPVPYAEPRP